MVSAACRAVCHAQALLQLRAQGSWARHWLPVVWQRQLLDSSECPPHSRCGTCNRAAGINHVQELSWGHQTAKASEVCRGAAPQILRHPAPCKLSWPAAREVLCSLLSRQKGPCRDSSSAAFWNPPVLCAGSQERSRLQSVQQSHLFHFPAPADLQIETHTSRVCPRAPEGIQCKSPRAPAFQWEPSLTAASRAEPFCLQRQRRFTSSLIPQLCPLQNTAASKSTQGISK